MERIRKFLGTWILQPEECRYEAGQPPKSGRYTISLEDERLFFQMVWTNAKDEKCEIEYYERPDGEEYPYENKHMADTIRVTAKSETVLESEGFKDNLLSMRATRELLDDMTMRVTFEGILTESQSYYNISLYKRLVT